MRRHGLTLLELTVILAILSVLALILPPVFVRSAENARRSACQSNLRQISLAIRQYMRDSNDYFPAVHGNKRFYGWADSIVPYLRTTQPFQCPSEATSPGIYDGPISLKYTDYFYNANLSSVNESSLQYVANTNMVSDSISGDATRNSNGDETALGSSKLIDLTDKDVGAATRHLDGANYAFADGHIKWLKGSDANTCPAIRNPGQGASASPTFSIQ